MLYITVMKALKKLVWAVDPFEEDSTAKKHSFAVLKNLAGENQIEIYPIHVISDGLLGLSVPRADLQREFKPLIEKQLRQYLSDSKLKNLKPAHAPVLAPSTRSQCADEIERYAKKIGADAIFTSSHGRSGLKRVFLGSFAETLVLHSKVPVILSGPRNSAFKKFGNILFPTDFSKRSETVFEKVVELAKKSNSRITLHYAVPHQLDTMLQAQAAMFGGAWMPAKAYLSNHATEQRKKAVAFVKLGRSRGVKVDVLIDLNSPSVSSSILRTAKKTKAGLIMMASESDAFSAAVLGSIGRVVAREAPCAVWFVRL